MAAHCAGGNNGEAILTATALLRTAPTVVRLAVGVATHEAQHPTARAARLVGHWFARREDRLGAAQPWPRISGLRSRESGRYEQTRQDRSHHDFPEHHRRNHFRISIFRTTKNANLFHSTSGSPGESLIVEPNFEPNFEPDFESRYPLRGAILAGDPNPALRRRHRERSDSGVALENWRRIAAARCTLDRFGPFTDRAAGTCQLERRLHHRAALRHCAMQSFARMRDKGLVAPGTPCAKRINALAFNRRVLR